MIKSENRVEGTQGNTHTLIGRLVCVTFTHTGINVSYNVPSSLCSAAPNLSSLVLSDFYPPPSLTYMRLYKLAGHPAPPSGPAAASTTFPRVSRSFHPELPAGAVGGRAQEAGFVRRPEASSSASGRSHCHRHRRRGGDSDRPPSRVLPSPSRGGSRGARQAATPTRRLLPAPPAPGPADSQGLQVLELLQLLCVVPPPFLLPPPLQLVLRRLPRPPRPSPGRHRDPRRA